MKLGIVVVYMVPEEDEPLLDLHLSQIQKCTLAPYRIYASTNRLVPALRPKIERNRRIQICEIPGTELRGHAEHAYYLDRLVDYAVRDGATHVCTLHVDSFPVTAGWARNIAPKLSAACPLASSLRDEKIHRKPSTDFMMFMSSFYSVFRPTMLLSRSVLSSGEYQRYQNACPSLPDSGVGYGFKIWSEKLSWLALPRAAEAEGSYHFGSLFGGVMFHLGGAVRNYSQVKASHRQIRTATMLGRVLPLAKKMTPKRLKENLRGTVEEVVVRPKYESIKEALLANPEAFLEKLNRDVPTAKSARLIKLS